MRGKDHSNTAPTEGLRSVGSSSGTPYKGSIMQSLREPPNPTLVQQNQEPIDKVYTPLKGKGYYQALMLCHSKGMTVAVYTSVSLCVALFVIHFYSFHRKAIVQTE